MSRREENVAAHFEEVELLKCQQTSWEVLNELAAWIKPGCKESDAKNKYQEICERRGISKYWHPPQIRFGTNTTLPYGEKGEDAALAKDDVFFLDIGPIVNGYEGDVGKAFYVGEVKENKHLVESASQVFDLVKQHWMEHNISGEKLYSFAETQAKNLGYHLSVKGASGHRIGDFPHAIHFRGKLNQTDFTPSPKRWILEIHLIDQKRNYGAFVEDIL